MARIKYTKKGQPYILLKSGKAKFIKKKSKKRYQTKMAKKRKSNTRKSRQNFFTTPLGTLASGVIYGFIRGKAEVPLANAVRKIPFIGDKIPADKLDNLGFGILSYLMNRGKIPFIKNIQGSRQIGKTGLAAEGVLLGSEIGMRTGNSGINLFEA